MRILFVIIFIIILILKSVTKHFRKATPVKKTAARTEHTTPPIRPVPAQKQLAGSGQWLAAKLQQDDAVQVHSVSMDSCERRLESLRILYDAGILDREEYAQRVARVREKHDEAI